MGSITLEERDRAILEALRDEDRAVDTLADRVGCDAGALRGRLPELADNGLVRQTEDGYALTESGARTTTATPTGVLDDRIDTPPAVDRAISALDLRPDKEEALRGAFAVLRYWGTATAGEIIDAVYSEDAAGFDDRLAWWNECVLPQLGGLPTVESPDSADWQWRFDGTPTVETDGEDGREVLDADATGRSSARYVVERLDLPDDEREAVRAAFDHLVREGSIELSTLEETVYPDYDAGYDSPEAWWRDCLWPALEALPGVEGLGEGLTYRTTD